MAVPVPVLRTARPPRDVPGFLARAVELGAEPLFWRRPSQLFGLIQPPVLGVPSLRARRRKGSCCLNPERGLRKPGTSPE